MWWLWWVLWSLMMTLLLTVLAALLSLLWADLKGSWYSNVEGLEDGFRLGGANCCKHLRAGGEGCRLFGSRFLTLVQSL